MRGQTLGVRSHSGGSWTSTERTASPVPPAAERIKRAEAERPPVAPVAPVGLELPSVEGLLPDLEPEKPPGEAESEVEAPEAPVAKEPEGSLEPAPQAGHPRSIYGH